ncbi:hypothetical protein LZC94_31215 [Pendulispora albinea]|uniref:Uncharacterized protein n=1 Tax=Pendulispora albinea TaxID=2741071 RepID=A0ABZ2LN16_9BACT
MRLVLVSLGAGEVVDATPTSSEGGPPARVVVDVGRSSFGHGAHVHARPACLVKACKGGLSRAFKTRVVADAVELGTEIAAGMDRRLEGLLLAARRSGNLTYGADAVCELLEQFESGQRGRDENVPQKGKDVVVVVARDADGSKVVSRRPIAEAIASGRAIAWGTKDGVGRLLGREEVALVAVTSASIASELRAVFAQGDACRFSENSSERRAVAGLGRVSAATSEGR